MGSDEGAYGRPESLVGECAGKRMCAWMGVERREKTAGLNGMYRLCVHRGNANDLVVVAVFMWKGRSHRIAAVQG